MRPTEINAFVGLEQLKKLKKNLVLRNKIFFKIYKSYLQNKNLVNLSFKKIKFFSPFSFPVICKTKIYKNKLLKKFIKNKVECRPMIAGNITFQPFYKNIYNKKNYQIVNLYIKTDFILGYIQK